ncbi:hypothetical protein AB0B28_07955 [Glycomyces sp. NPDC046736]|uniref:hypothetical protein n=1 Tax=Glycomyces sp. NPDC046736 TaxID=3155615 RepID=UPI0033CA6E56
MNAPVRESRLNRAHLIVTIVTSLAAVGLGVFSIVKQDQAQELTVNIEGLSDDLSAIESERDSYSARVDELEAELADTGDETGETTVSSPAALDFEDNLAVENCTNYRSSGGQWNTEPVRLGGQEYTDAFSCVPYITDATIADGRKSVGYVDFAVPGGAERLTGVVGIADDSADTAMVLEFIVLPVPETGEPLFAQTLKYGDVQELDLDLSGTSRVRFQVEIVDTEVYGALTDGTATASWAEVRMA